MGGGDFDFEETIPVLDGTELGLRKAAGEVERADRSRHDLRTGGERVRRSRPRESVTFRSLTPGLFGCARNRPSSLLSPLRAASWVGVFLT